MTNPKHMTLREARDYRDMTQEELEAATVRAAAELGAGYAPVDQRNISKIERGDIHDPRNSTVAVLERALRLRRGTLVFGVTVAA
jgi:transcriptional regulator with XRE-family HTH domain